MEGAENALQAINLTLGEIKRSLNELTAVIKEYGGRNKPDCREIADEAAKRICEGLNRGIRDIDAG